MQPSDLQFSSAGSALVFASSCSLWRVVVLLTAVRRAGDPALPGSVASADEAGKTTTSSGTARVAASSRGELSEDQLQTALEAQRTGRPRRIGEWLQILNLASEQQVLAGLGLQWAVPVLSSPPAGLQSCASLLPPTLRRELKLVPVRYVGSSNELYLASCEQADQSVLASIAQMLNCSIQACLVSERTLSNWLETDLGVDEDTTQSFEGVHSLAEILRIICSYAARLSSDELRIARCQSHIWVRLSRREQVTHLLFRFSEPSLAWNADSPYLPAAV